MLYEPRNKRLDQISGAHESRIGMPNLALAQEFALTQPAVEEGEVLTAVVDRVEFDPGWYPITEHGGPLPDAIRNLGKPFGQMDRGV